MPDTSKGRCAILAAMTEDFEPFADDYWREKTQLFTAQFPVYYTKPQKVWGRFHIDEEAISAQLLR